MNKTNETKERILNLIEAREKRVKEYFDKYIALNPTDEVRKKINCILIEEYHSIYRDVMNMEV